MKAFLTFIILILFSFNSCSKSNDDTTINDTPKNLSELIVGKWKYPDSPCHSGYIYKSDGTWSWGDFDVDDCNPESCGYLIFGGTYTINGNILFSTGGPGESDNLRGKIEITGGVFKVYDENTNVLIETFSKAPEC